MKYFLWIILFTVLVGCKNEQATTDTDVADKENVGVDTIFAQYFEERLRIFPLEATYAGDNRFNDYLTIDISESFRDTLRNFYQLYLARLEDIQTDGLSETQRLNYDILKRDLQMSLDGLKFKDNLMPVNQFWAMPLTFAQLGSGKSSQPFKTVEDYDNFLGRMEDYKSYSDTIISNMKRGAAENIVLPKVLAEKMLPQYKALVTQDITQNLFYQPVQNFPADFSEEDKKRLTEAYKKAITEQIIPAYQNLYNYINTEYLPATRATSGISGIPGGEDYYKYLVKYWTTTDMTPDEIFELGQKEVARIRSEMEKVKNEVGYKGNLQAFFKHLRSDPKFFPFTSAQQVLDRFRSIHDTMKPYLAKSFNNTPKTPFEIRQTEKFREASASAEYSPGTPDGSRPGIFYVPIPNPKEYNPNEMESLFLHEAIPGHHYQISLQQENPNLPKFRQFSWYGAYGEGWALYSESLGKELGLYTDPYQYFGRLSAEMHRAIRLVVDVGMHTKGWTREQAIEYSLQNEATSRDDAIAEIERYMAIPGQALSYKIGELKILELRRKAEQALGDKFSLAAFHDEVLEDGVLPLDVLEKKINRWIDDQQ